MTKKELLDTLKNSTLKNDYSKDSGGKSGLYVKYYPVIEALLTVFPKNAELKGVPVLDNDNVFEDFESFESFIKDNSYEIIDRKLASLQDQLNMWVSSHSEELVVLNYIDRKRKIGMYIFIVFISLVCIASLVCTVLSFCKVWEFESQFSLALDTLGLISGLIFFVYERVTDSKKENVHNSATAKDRTEFTKQYNNISKKISFGIYIGHNTINQ